MNPTQNLRIVIEEYLGDEIGISEIEVFDHIIDLEEYDLPFTNHTVSETNRVSLWMRIQMLVEKIFFYVKEYIVRKIVLSKWEMKVRYPNSMV